jgi:exopolysaccharide biosynthesis protein
MLYRRILASLLLTLVLGLNQITEACTLIKQQITINGCSYTIISIALSDKDQITFTNGNKYKLAGAKTSSWIAKAYGAEAAINGGFFKRDSGLPLGILYKDDTLLTGPIYNRSALIGYKDGSFSIKSLSFKGVIRTETSCIEFNNYNQPRLSKSQVIIYTQKWTSIVSSIFKGGRLLGVRNGKIIKESSEKMTVPIDGYVIYGPEAKLSGLKVGDSVNYTYKIPEVDLKEVKFMIGAGPKLVEASQIINNVAEERFSAASIYHGSRRSVVGLKNGKLYLAVVYRNGSVTINNLSQVLKVAGFDEAMNLDGGSSTQLYYKGKTLIYGAPVNNSIIIY